MTKTSPHQNQPKKTNSSGEPLSEPSEEIAMCESVLEMRDQPNVEPFSASTVNEQKMYPRMTINRSRDHPVDHPTQLQKELDHLKLPLSGTAR